jgi:lipopolysaccharide heptosyltransferase II
MARALPIYSRDDYGYPPPPDTRKKVRNTTVRFSKKILLTIIYLCMSAFGLLLRSQRAGKKYPPLKPQYFQPKRILIIRMDLIGDLVLSLPIVRLLKRTYPQAEIDILALPSSAKVIASDPDVRTIITYDPNIWRRPKSLFKPGNWRAARKVYRELHAQNYDLAVSVFGPWAAILAVFSGAQRRLGYGKESYPGLMTDDVAGQHWNAQDHLHEVDYCLRLAQAAGATIEAEDRVPTLYVGSQARQEVETLLQNEGIAHATTLIACHVSANNGQAKRWPLPYWATLIDRLILEAQATVVFTGAPDDQPLIAAITVRMHEQAINLAGKTSLTQLAALLQRVDLLLTGDSGPMHIAGAVKTDLIAIHGPTDPRLSGPVSPQATILRDTIWCSPCYKAKGAPADCRFYTTQCMKNITPAQVFNAIQNKLHPQPELPLAIKQAPSVEGSSHEQNLS